MQDTSLEIPDTPERNDPSRLQPFLKCFHDIQVCRVKLILRVSTKTVVIAQRLDGPESMPWPFIKLKNSHLPPEKWVMARQARADAIRSSETSEGMRYCLFRAERAAICMRALYMPRAMAKAVGEVDFPEMPDSIAELLHQQIFTLGTTSNKGQRLQQCTRAVARVYRRIPAVAQMQEIGRLLNLMVDLPIKKVCAITGMPLKTVMALCNEAGMEVWPYNAVYQGKWLHTMDEVRALREAALSTLGPHTYQRYLLAKAKEAAELLFVLYSGGPKSKKRMRTTPQAAAAPPTPAALLPPTQPPPEKEVEKPADWSGRSLLSDDEEEKEFTKEYLNFWRDICDSPTEMWSRLCEDD